MDKIFFLEKENLRQVAKTYGTPLYIYSEKIIQEKAKILSEMPAPYGLTVRYAAKALTTRAIIKIIDKLGLHFDASSAWEAKRLMDAGIAPDKILLTSQELSPFTKELIQAGIHFTAVSPRQLIFFGENFRGEKLSIRLNPGIGSGHVKRTNVAGTSSSFGFWYEKIPEINKLLEKYQLTVERIHIHIGSGSDPDVWKQVAAKALKLIECFPQARILNLGGGFKVARMPFEKDTDILALGKAVYFELEKFAAQTGRKLHLEIEPGTFLLAQAGLLLSQVNDKVDTGENGYTFLKLDSGMNDITRPTLYGVQHPLMIVSQEPERNEANTEKVIVVGHNCESSDILTPKPGNPEEADTVEIPETLIGDYIVVGAAGAYVSAMSFANYNSFPRTPEILIQENGEIRLIRKAESLEMMIQNEL
ncbi:MAG TPA: diaminopimelate decarboxylase [Candidatus Marinimicrobia bacterium]|nr:diaminopimelate decarboxylase [Candidatus Neomarinimicrobiota bacterium]